MLMHPRGKCAVSLVAAGLAALIARDAAAQETPPFDAKIDLQLFEYASGPKSFFSVSSTETAGDNQYTADFMITFLTNPLVVYDVDRFEDEIVDTRTSVVNNLVAGQISGAYGIGPNMQVAAALPMIFSMTGDGLDPSTGRMSPGGLQVSGLGDLRLDFKMRAWQQDDLSFAWTGSLSIPTSVGAGGSDHQSGGDFVGDNLPDVRGRAIFQWRDPSGRMTAGANLGLVFRKPRVLYSSKVGQQFTYGLGGSYRVHSRASVIAETFGRTGLFDFDVDSSPLEFLAGVRVAATPFISVVAGGGGGIVRGIGSPDVRAFVSVGYYPDYRDSDGDGIPDYRDQCPFEPEDFDGFEDEDGCPDPDNDGDGIPDEYDLCPNDAEDFDGFEDEDGCPELDNDGDGIPDAVDRCPNQPEDGLPPFPNDGCPAWAVDSDDDGIPDDRDMCPLEPEDFDGFEDEDGCPDPDNDGDGIPDELDKCPMCAGVPEADGCPIPDRDGDGIPNELDKCPEEAGTLNGFQDFDGCPSDRPGRQVATMEGDRLILDAPIRFRRGAQLVSTMEIDQVAIVMLQNPEVAQWRVVVALAPGRNEANSRSEAQAQANAIKDRIVAAHGRLNKRNAADAIEAVGAVSDSPLVAFVVLERAVVDYNTKEFCPEGAWAVPNPRTTPDWADAPASTPPSAPQPSGEDTD
jgi:OmpA-OmpF porin, OOP family